MAIIKVPTGYDSKAILLADDEPEHLDWLVDFLNAKGMATTVVTNVYDTIKAMNRMKYRAYFVDLNIPLGQWVPAMPQVGKTYDDYHGLYIAKLVRSQGISGRRVIIYSAHHNQSIVSEVKRLYCRYIVKGRPRELKQDIEELLLHEPRERPPAPKHEKRTVRKQAIRKSSKRPIRASRHREEK